MHLYLRTRARINRALSRMGFSRDWHLVPLAAIVGTLAGLVAMGFKWMVETSNHLFGRVADAKAFDDSVVMLIALPALGGLAVGLIQRYISRQPAGHGIPDVIVAMTRRGGVLRRRTGIIKAITASLTIGSGGSAGVEGPIVQIGSVLGSAVGQTLGIRREHMNTLVGCGAAAGLASIFNAPIAGVIFVLEVMLRDFSLKTFMPIVVASVFGTALTQTVLGHKEALFAIPEMLRHYEFSWGEIWLYAILGVACGFVGVAFTKSLYAVEGITARIKLPAAIKPALGGMLMGVLGVAFAWKFADVVPGYEQPAFYANGYPVIEALFDPASYRAAAASDAANAAHLTLWFLFAALACKFVGTLLTLGSGGSGGIFAPSLFMGAMLGAAVGMFLQQQQWFPYEITPAAYALAGMAGVLAAAVHCPLSAFLLVFELTQDYKVILPVMLVAIVATTVSQIMQRESIYTLALREQGIRMGGMTDMTLLRRVTAAQVPLTPAVMVKPTDPARNLLDLAQNPLVNDFVVVDDKGKYLGLVVGEDLRATLLQQDALPLLVVGDLLRIDPPMVSPEETLDAVLAKFSRHEVASLPVCDRNDPTRIVGMISRIRLMHRYQKTLEES